MKSEIQNHIQFDLKSILAGIMIGLGSIIFCMCLPISKILGSFLFSLGLLSVIIQQYNLYTGKIGYLNFSVSDIFRLLRIIIGNIIGVYLITLCMTYTNIYPVLIENADIVMSNKINDDCLSLFVLGIGCGIMMFLAVDSGQKRPNNPIIVILPVMFFILCGFEHCIADAGYFFLSSYNISSDVIMKFLSIVAGNTVGSIALYRLNKIY